MIDNFTYLRGAHSYKVGFDWQHIYDERTARRSSSTRSRPIAAYLAAKSGAAPFGYTTISQITGDLAFNMSTNIFSTFGQDDWQIAPTPEGALRRSATTSTSIRPASPTRRWRRRTSSTRHEQLRAARRRRLGDRIRRTVLRASTGIMYDQPMLGGYEQALQLSGSPRAPVYSFNGTARGAPAFPSGADDRHAARSSRPGRSIRTSRSRTPGRSARRSSARSASDFTARSA